MQINRVIDHLWELTHCGELQDAVERYNNLRGTGFYKDRSSLVRSLKGRVQEDLSKGGSQVTSKAAERYIWFVLMLPIDLDIFRVDLQGLLPALRPMLRKLVHESIGSGLITSGEAGDIFTRLVRSAKIILGQKTVIRQAVWESGAAYFYSRMAGNPFFQHFSLAAAAFFNWRTARAFKENLGPTRAAPERVRSPLGKRLVDPYAILAKTFKFMEAEDYSPLNLTPEQFLKAMEEDCLERGYVASTMRRRLLEYSYFMMATKGSMTRSKKTVPHKTLWCWNSVNEKNQAMVTALEEEEERDGSDRALILADIGEEIEDDATVDQLVPLSRGGPVGSELDQPARDLQDYLRCLRREKIAAHIRSGGLVLLRHSWLDKRCFTLERLCALIGYYTGGNSVKSLFKTNDADTGLGALCILESAFTGTSIRRILSDQSRAIPAPSTFINPIGLFAAVDDLREIFNGASGAKGDASNLEEKIRAKFHEFNQSYPFFHLTVGSLTYGGRAWMIDKMNINRLLASHVCGVWLPGVRASGQYVRVSGLVERLVESQMALCDRLLWVAKNTTLKTLDPISTGETTPTDLLRRAIPALQEWSRQLKALERVRQKKFDMSESGILAIPDDNQMFNLFRTILNRYDGALGEEKPNWLSALVLTVLCAYLLLRPGEAERLPVKCIFLNDSAALIAGKSNRMYAEYRTLPLPDSVNMLIYHWLGYRLENNEKNFGIGSSIVLNFEKAREKLEIAFEDSGMGHFNLYTLRKWGATRIHNSGTGFEEWQALMGHSQRGFESLGCYSFLPFSRLRKCFEQHLKPVEPLVSTATRKIKELIPHA